jgi:hypothetical protein
MLRAVHVGRGGLAAAVVAVGLTLVATPGRAGADTPPPACGPATPPYFELVAPATLPVGYPSGFYLETSPTAASPAGSPLLYDLTLAPAAGGGLTHAYSGVGTKRDLYNRWPLQFAPGDGPALISVTFGELHGTTECARTLTALVRPAPNPDPHLRLRHTRVRGYLRHTKYRTVYELYRMRVTGTLARSATRPVRLVVYEGDVVRVWTLVRSHHRRFAAMLHWHGEVGQLGPLRITALYPGDVNETWPCDDVFTTSVHDGCRKRLRNPIDALGY